MMRRFLLLLVLLFLLLPAALPGQIHPRLSTGRTWSQQAYELPGRPTLSQPLPAGCPNIQRIFDSLHTNYEIYYDYTDSIYINTFQDEWAEMMIRRAAVQSRLYAENNRDLDSLFNYFRKTADIPDVAYDAVLGGVHLMFRERNQDIFLMKELCDIVLPHYEQIHTNKDRLILCYSAAGFCHYRISCIDGDKEMLRKSMNYYKKAIGLTDNMEEFKGPIAPFYLLCSYHNLMTVLSARRYLPLQEAYDLRQQLEQLHRKNRKVFRDIPNLEKCYDWTCRMFDLTGAYLCVEGGDTQSSLFKNLYSRYQRCIGNGPQCEFTQEPYTYHMELMINHLYMQAAIGKMDPDKALQQARELLDRKFSGEYQSVEISISHLYNTLTASAHLMELGTMTHEEKHDCIITYMKEAYDIIFTRQRTLDAPERIEAERNLITMPFIRIYLTAEERQSMLHKIVLLEQPQTYAHISMVSRLCDVVLDYVIDYNPDLLRDIPNCSTRYDVWRHADELKTYFHSAAFFHDLGKNLMPSIVCNSFRRLTDLEFKYIRMHPELAQMFLNLDPSLRIYHDTCVGHHKWYNGKGGYPAWFDNTKSPVRILIDILTICDCTDAATESLGRNYHKQKKFKNVLMEFDADAGTRYNPDIVQLIHDVPALYDALIEIVDEKRMEEYYNIYMQYFK